MKKIKDMKWDKFGKIVFIDLTLPFKKELFFHTCPISCIQIEENGYILICLPNVSTLHGTHSLATSGFLRPYDQTLELEIPRRRPDF